LDWSALALCVQTVPHFKNVVQVACHVRKLFYTLKNLLTIIINKKLDTGKEMLEKGIKNEYLKKN
jgi:hypothetical protein